MRILIVSPEIYPYAKTGSIADTISGLSKAISKLGTEVYLATPLYKVTKDQNLKLRPVLRTLGVPFKWEKKVFKLFEYDAGERMKVFFFDADEFSTRDGLYGTEEGDYPDNCERFAAFSKGCLFMSKYLSMKFDVIHLNDWQTAPVAVYLKVIFNDDPIFANTKVIYTIHNLGYQGVFDKNIASGFGLDLLELEYYGKVNFAKGGILFSDIITTVSETYGEEMRTKEFGCGLDEILRARSANICAISNGIDYDVWNPKIDPYVYEHYDTHSIITKRVNKTILRRELKLDNVDVPLIGMVCRLDTYKGVDILLGAINELMKEELQFVLLGTGEERFTKRLAKLSASYPRKASVNIKFDPVLACRIYAGSDIFLVPSKYEPSGLSSLIALRYGSIPIVRKTGALLEKITEFDPKTLKGNGFVFEKYSANELVSAVKKAVFVYKAAEVWRKLTKNAMSERHTLDTAAKTYNKLYKRMSKQPS